MDAFQFTFIIDQGDVFVLLVVLSQWFAGAYFDRRSHIRVLPRSRRDLITRHSTPEEEDNE